MKNIYKQKRETGFTIIETLIVLAIAALIFLIVFLAVPALQRNSRNNAVRNDAANLISGVNTFESNNNGQLPTSIDCTTTPGTATVSSSVSGTQSNTIGVQASDTCKKVDGSTFTGGTGWPGPGTVYVATGYKCKDNQNLSANARSVAAVFVVETSSSNNADQCIDG